MSLRTELNCYLIKEHPFDSPDGPVVKTPCFQGRGVALVPGQGTKMPHAIWCRLARRNINNLRYADHTTLTAESEEEPKNLWMKVKEESEKVGLKLNIQQTKIMASGPITSWEIDGERVETVETVSNFILGAPKSLQMVTAAMKLKLKESHLDAYN